MKEASNHGLVLKKVHKFIQFNHKTWFKSYIGMNTKLKTEGKNDFETSFFKLINHAVFEKTMESLRKHRDIKLVITNKKENYLVSEHNYHTTTCYMDTDNFNINIKTKDIYEAIANDVEKDLIHQIVQSEDHCQ